MLGLRKLFVLTGILILGFYDDRTRTVYDIWIYSLFPGAGLYMNVTNLSTGQAFGTAQLAAFPKANTLLCIGLSGV